MKTVTTAIPYSYTTIKTTQSRIEKGLLAVPASLIHLFPTTSGHVYLVDEKGVERRTTFTAYSRTSKECRIGGMRSFYEKYQIEDGDELVLYIREDARYQILPEGVFHRRIKELEVQLDKAPSNVKVNAALDELANVTNKKPEEVIWSEYVRLAQHQILKRKTRRKHSAHARETVSPPFRKILLSVYGGRCQVSNFSFQMRTGQPFFEVHHIDPLQGDHLMNLLVVSPNVHAQFHYAHVEHFWDDMRWLREVKFNGEGYPVFQAIDQAPATFKKEVHSVESN
jgi:hypothetical protein